MNKNYLCNRHGQRLSTHSTYYDAVTTGQKTLGYGNFEVQTPGRVPTREEQLLLDRPSVEDKRKEILKGL